MRRSRRQPARPLLLLLVLALGGAAGCLPRVQPWQREHLSKRALRFDAERLEQRFRQHMFSSREASDFGYGEPGGGCGCN
jgi:hypothetical protein